MGIITMAENASNTDETTDFLIGLDVKEALISVDRARP